MRAERVPRGRWVVAGWAAMLVGCSSSPRAKEPAPAPSEGRAEAGDATRAPDELDRVRAECGVLSEDCVRKAVRLLKTHPDPAVRMLSDACAQGIAIGCVELGHAYAEGGALPQDQVRADDAYAKACRLDPSWCD